MRPLIEYLAAIIVTILLLGLSECVTADDWTRADTTRQIVYTALLAADAATTIDIGNHPEVEESVSLTRHILGANPEPLETAAYFSVLGLANYAIARQLPAGKWRSGFQTLSAITSGQYVVNNWKLGLRPAWR